MSTLNIKIDFMIFEDQKIDEKTEKPTLIKTFQVSSSDRVEEVIKLIKEKVSVLETKPSKNFGFGLFYNDLNDEKKSYWLMNSKMIGFYGIENGATLYYKEKDRTLNVKMLDGTKKKLVVDDSKSVGHALEVICEKIGINSLNADEYALFIEEEKEQELLDIPIQVNRRASVMDLIMDKVDQIQEKKVQTIKKKAHTDDDTNWLRNDKTFREVGVHNDSVVVIRRRYVYEKSVNITNPVEINLLYNQYRDNILDGSYPCQLDEAALFAAYQIQVQYGDFDELRYKSGNIDFKECVPKEYFKNKEIQKKIKKEHSKLVGINELDSKYKYIQLCQNLPTYGVTFFVVKEKIDGKNKLIPRLFGVSKESCFRLDEKTKQVLKVWPLTSVKKWASSPTSFTLDFGDYKEGMYTVVTSEGKQICQLIGGYIDIILKRRKRIQMLMGDGDDHGVIAEGTNLPCRRIDISRNNFLNVQESIPQYPRRSSVQGLLSSGQQALTSNLDNSGKAVMILVDELNEESSYDINEPLYEELETEKVDGEYQIEDLMSDIATGVVSIVNKTSNNPSDEELVAVGNSVTSLTSNLTDLTRKLKLQTKVLDNEPDNGSFLDAAKDLAHAFKGLFISLNPKENNRSEVTINVNKISRAFIKINHKVPKNPAFNKVLLEMVNEIKNASDLILAASDDVSQALDGESLLKINKIAAQSKQRMIQFTSSINLLLPYITSSNAQAEISDLIEKLNADANTLGELCLAASSDDNSKYKIQSALIDIKGSSDALLKHIEKNNENFAEQNMYDVLLDANDAFFKCIGDSGEMIKQAIIIGQTCAQLAKSIELSANNSVDEKEKKLEAVAKLSSATAALLKSAKVLRDQPDDYEKQAALKSMVIDAQNVANIVTGDAIKAMSITKLCGSADAALKSTSQMLATAKNVAIKNTDSVAQEYNKISSVFMTVNNKDLADAVKECEPNPKNEIATRKLMSSSKCFVPAASRLILASRALVTPESKTTDAFELSHTILQAEKSLKELSKSMSKASQDKLAYEKVLDTLKSSLQDLEQVPLNDTDIASKGNMKDSPKILHSRMVNLCENVESLIPALIEKEENNIESVDNPLSTFASHLSTLSELVVSFATSTFMSMMPSKQAEMLSTTKTTFESAINMINALNENIDEQQISNFQPDTSNLEPAVVESNNSFKTALKESKELLKDISVENDVWDYAVKAVEVNKKNLADHDGETMLSDPLENDGETILTNPIKNDGDMILANPIENDNATKLNTVHHQNVAKALKIIDQKSHCLAEICCTEPNEQAAINCTIPNDLDEIVQHVSMNYGKLCEDIKQAKIIKSEMGKEFIANTLELGDACVKMMTSAKKFHIDQTEANKKVVAENVSGVSAKVALLVLNVENGFVGRQECVDRMDTLDELIAEINSTKAVAKNHNLFNIDNSTFEEHKEEVLVSIQNVGKNLKAITNMFPVSQTNVAVLVKDAIANANNLGSVMKKAATALGTEDADGQVLLLNAVKDVISALKDLINETEKISDSGTVGDSMKAISKHMVTNLASLLKAVKSIKNESLRGARAVESALEAIQQAIIKNTSSPMPDKRTTKNITPDDLIQATKGINFAIAKVEAAGASLRQADIIEAANVGRTKCLELFEVAQAMIQCTEDDIVREAIVHSVNEANEMYCGVLKHLAQMQNQPELKEEFSTLTQRVTQSVGELVGTAEEINMFQSNQVNIYQSKPAFPTLKFVLKLSDTESDLVCCNDSNVAEIGLLEAAASVEASVKKITELNPKTFKKKVGFELNFEDRILEAAKEVISASANLLKAASLQQKELLETGRIAVNGTNVYVNSRQWADGLVSAAYLVVSTTDSLCDSANGLVLGKSSQEKLIAAAQAVSASTAHLLLASRVKASPFSKVQKNLQAAGASVKSATERLVKTAREGVLYDAENIESYKKVRRGTKTSEIIEQIEAQENILKKERELNLARRRLEVLREQQYAKERADGYSDDESGTSF
ncbi:talin-1 isoform X2 [Hydra vulgaris]|uniref:Talin-1 isoform X2 n=1 Tax=Hydra vulgaris TaxID=6087 RepID=A0ABM4BDX0_HYDVU